MIAGASTAQTLTVMNLLVLGHHQAPVCGGRSQAEAEIVDARDQDDRVAEKRIAEVGEDDRRDVRKHLAAQQRGGRSPRATAASTNPRVDISSVAVRTIRAIPGSCTSATPTISTPTCGPSPPTRQSSSTRRAGKASSTSTPRIRSGSTIERTYPATRPIVTPIRYASSGRHSRDPDHRPVRRSGAATGRRARGSRCRAARRRTASVRERRSAWRCRAGRTAARRWPRRKRTPGS